VDSNMLWRYRAWTSCRDALAIHAPPAKPHRHPANTGSVANVGRHSIHSSQEPFARIAARSFPPRAASTVAANTLSTSGLLRRFPEPWLETHSLVSLFPRADSSNKDHNITHAR